MKKISLLIPLIIVLLIAAPVFAQVSYEDPTFTSYTVANLGTSPTDIVVSYYNETGALSPGPSFTGVPVGGSVTVQQSLEGTLADGKYSAVISAGQRIAAIANQQLGTDGSGTSIAPFSSYSGASEGANEVSIPVIMYNWFGYYTELFIQNADVAEATNIQITYSPTTIGSCTTGTAGADSITSLLPNQAKTVSQLNKTSLGAPNVGGCEVYTNRFLGSATITSDQKIVVVANQYVQDKLFTYNGFTQAGTKLIAPAYMRNWFNYYGSITITNPNATNATVNLTYTPDSSLAPAVNPTAPVLATHAIPAGESINIYDGPSATAAQSDLLAVYNLPTERYFGSILITSDVPVVAMVNQEATGFGGNQAGAYNVFAVENTVDSGFVSEGACEYSAPLIQSDFYGYYTSMTIMTTDGSDATLEITYTSDGVYSAVLNQSKTYTMSTTNGFINRYEGASASAAQSDILDDAAWEAGGSGRFIGSAVVKVQGCTADIVAFVNEESNTAPFASIRDSMYTYNGFNMD